jgi:hypothetical protein
MEEIMRAPRLTGLLRASPEDQQAFFLEVGAELDRKRCLRATLRGG